MYIYIYTYIRLADRYAYIAYTCMRTYVHIYICKFPIIQLWVQQLIDHVCMRVCMYVCMNE